MKKTKILLSAMALLLLGMAATSCDKDPIVFQSTNSRIMENDIKWGDWLAGPNYIYVTYDWDAISTDVLNYGTVSAYVYDNGHQCPLPYAYPMGPLYYDIDGNDTIDFIDNMVEQIRCEFEPGKITFIMQDLDGNLPEIIPYSDPITVRAVATVPVQYVIDK